MVPQSTFMVCAEIIGDQVENLRQLLGGMNCEPGVVDPNNSLVPFAQFKGLHVARFAIIESQTNDDVEAYNISLKRWPPTLIFLGDCDGPYDLFLAEVAVRAGPGLRKIFSHCVNFNPESEILLEWMLENNKKPTANYINWIGRTVTQVHEEIQLHRLLNERVRQMQQENGVESALGLHQDLRQFVRSEIDSNNLELSKEPRTPVKWRVGNFFHKVTVPLALLLLTPLFLVLAPFYALKLRMLERSDLEITPRPDPDHISKLAAHEDRMVTNQFTAFGDVKPGLFRRYTIIFLLFMLNYAARHIYNRGFLTRVQTIHFARWVLLDDKTRVLFASNYDGDLESYMDDFINKVGWGLNLVFSNGIGWPRTRWLIKGGSLHEQKFKYYLRRHQHLSDVWYKAYPDATAVDIARNSEIRQGLEKQRFASEQDAQKWVQLI
ncbi:MAG: hypothetical protein WBM41_00220 [Arenicellales bacterium]